MPKTSKNVSNVSNHGIAHMNIFFPQFKDILVPYLIDLMRGLATAQWQEQTGYKTRESKYKGTDVYSIGVIPPGRGTICDGVNCYIRKCTIYYP